MFLKEKLRNPYVVLVLICFYSMAFALFMDTPGDILKGLQAIVVSKDILITDYIEIAGIGASLFNASLVCLIILSYFIRAKVEPSGSAIMVMWLLAGFSFFGKNIVSIWPVMLGGYLYSKYRREPFSKYAVVTMLATSLSPAVSQIIFDESFPFPVGILLGIALGSILGFIMSPISNNAMHSHHGYNLYNVGYAAGIVAIMLRITLQNLGMTIIPVFIWNKTSTNELTIFLTILFVFLILIGLYCGENNKKNLLHMMRQSGRLVSDFYRDYAASCYINMGLLGLISTFCIRLLGGDINGPVIAGIFTVAGFGCFGKHLRNTLPIMIGCMLGGGFSHVSGQDPAAALSILFGTCLAPIAGTFGVFWGLVAGFLHMNISLNIGEFTGGINLYNNGLAGGLVVMFLLPLIHAFKYGNNTEDPI